MTGKAPSTDKFIAMVSAKAETELRLCDFEPHAMIATPVHEVKRARFPAIDYHNHLDAQEPKEILKVMDECGVERIVNITMRVGDEAPRSHGSLSRAWLPIVSLPSRGWTGPICRSPVFFCTCCRAPRKSGCEGCLRNQALEGSWPNPS